MDIPEYLPFLGDREVEAAKEAISNGWISPAGGEVTEFEEKFSSFMGGGNSVAVDSGTAALHLALESLDLGEDAEVIVPDLTYGATGLAVLEAGLEPVLADIEPETLGLDPESFRGNITSDTEAVIVVHLYGRPARMDEIREIARENDIAVIEDAALAVGAEYRGEKAGSLGDIGCFSFAWNKNITTGKGGMVYSRNDLSQVRKLADYGRKQDKRFEFDETGYNYLMDNIRAAIGIEQLERLEETFETKEKIFDRYRRLMPDDIEVFTEERDYVKASPTAFCIFVDDRDGLMQHLEDKGIGCRKIFEPLNGMEAFPDGEYPVSEDKAGRGLVLPSHPDLTEEDVEKVVDEIRKYRS